MWLAVRRSGCTLLCACMEVCSKLVFEAASAPMYLLCWMGMHSLLCEFPVPSACMGVASTNPTIAVTLKRLFWRADAAAVRAWDFSGAEGLQERADARRAARDGQRSLRRQRGGAQPGGRTPRFPPPPGSCSCSDEDDDNDADGCDGVHESTRHAAAEQARSPEEAGSAREGCGGGAASRCGDCDTIYADLARQEASSGERGGGGNAAHVAERKRGSSWGAPGSTSLGPAALPSPPCAELCGDGGCMREGCAGGNANSSSTGRAGPARRGVPPPVVAPPGLRRAGLARMTSWDILRPQQKGLRDGIKVSG